MCTPVCVVRGTIFHQQSAGLTCTCAWAWACVREERQDQLRVPAHDA